MKSKDYQKIFDQSSAVMVVVDTDYSVSAASKGFLKATLNDRENIIDRKIFNVFPKIGKDIEQVLVNTMRDSFRQVVETKEAHTTDVVRYDIPKENADDDADANGFMVRYWKAINTPILNEKDEVKYIKQIYVDVTDSENLSAQLDVEKDNLDEYKSAEKYIRNTFEQAPVPICILRGEEHLFEMANDEFLALANIEDYIGKSVREVLPELEDQDFFEILDKVYESEESFVGSEMPINFHPEQEEDTDIYVDFVYQILYDTEGNKEGVFVLGVEVTERVLARKKLEESEHRFRSLIEKSTVAASLYTGPDLVVQYANDKMLQVLNKGEEIIGKPMKEVLPELKDQPFFNYLKEVYESGEQYEGVEEKAELKIDGDLQTFYFNFTYTPLRNADGKIYGILDTSIDVTDEVMAKRALEKSENTLKQLLNSMPQKISHTDEESNMVFFNDQWIDETGYSMEELKNKGWFKTIHPDDTEEAKESWYKAVESGSAVEGEYRLIHKKLGYRWNLNRAVPIKNDNGNIRMWVDTKTDIHDQKKQEEILEKAVAKRTEELKQANLDLVKQNQEIEKQKQEMEAFAYVSSHDLQEPLRKIQIFAGRIQDLESQNLSDKGLGYFERMQEAAERMQILIEDLLSFSRVKNEGKDFERVDLNQVIEEVKSELKEVIEEKKATVKVHNTCQTEVITFQFRQLLKNLISNAIKFSKPDTQPVVVINGQNLTGEEVIKEEPEKYEKLKNNILPEKKYCHISVKDNGIGFEPNFSDRIFEVFQRLHTRDKFEGTGIGLAIVKKIVENHNGIITADSELNEGARFDIYIPVEQ